MSPSGAKTNMNVGYPLPAYIFVRRIQEGAEPPAPEPPPRFAGPGSPATPNAGGSTKGSRRLSLEKFGLLRRT
jgi:hypothetical protein